jgi:hypothetical protein
VTVAPGRGPVFNDGDLLVAAALEGFGILYILEDLVASPMAVSRGCWSRGASRSLITPIAGARRPSDCSRRRFKQAGPHKGLVKRRRRF